jgi:hypothetical protein
MLKVAGKQEITFIFKTHSILTLSIVKFSLTLILQKDKMIRAQKFDFKFNESTKKYF